MVVCSGTAKVLDMVMMPPESVEVVVGHSGAAEVADMVKMPSGSTDVVVMVCSGTVQVIAAAVVRLWSAVMVH